MTTDHVQERLSIIQEMIDRSRRETAESGRFFVWIGLISIVAVFVVRWIEATGLTQLVLPALAVVLVANGVVGYAAIARRQKMVGARSYPAAVSTALWFACGVAVALALFLFPVLGVYRWDQTPVLAALIMGVGAFASGSVFETPIIAWSSIAWWGGAVALALVDSAWPRGFIMAAVLLLGMVVPGLVLDRQYARQRGSDVS